MNNSFQNDRYFNNTNQKLNELNKQKEIIKEQLEQKRKLTNSEFNNISTPALDNEINRLNNFSDNKINKEFNKPTNNINLFKKTNNK